MSGSYLTLITFIPLAGTVLILLLPRQRVELIKRAAALFSLVPLLLAVAMWAEWGQRAAGAYGMRFLERLEWIPSLGISYLMGTDGLSFPLVFLTALLSFVAVMASWGMIKHREKDFFALLLLLETGMMGVFLALDYIVFYVFWELVLVPMYFLIGIWGGPRREYAAIKFFIYTLVGSVVMLIGILALYFGTGAVSFNMMEIASKAGGMLTWRAQLWVFLALFLGFAVKVPVFPFHTWLPDAHVEAPTPISVVLAAILLKMGTYGFFRISYPTLPDAARAFAVMFAALGLINIVYGALTAMAQKDLKKLVAYSSISHMGFVLLGLAAGTHLALAGAMYMNISHGLISGLLFLMVGAIYDRTHTREIPKLSGLYVTVPVIATVLAFGAFANLGLPGLAGFIAEFFVLAGVFPASVTWVALAVLGMLVVAGFNLWMMQRTLMGEKRAEYAELPDATPLELFTYAPVVALIVILGVAPGLLMRFLDGPAADIVLRLGGM
ncbi:MAG: NADH-quinone oxidoreductase subunit M [Bacillota bacterium]